jgi:uncharacterized protein YciI
MIAMLLADRLFNELESILRAYDFLARQVSQAAEIRRVPMWYLVMRRAVKPREEWTVNLDEHLVWMKQQHDNGRILFSGPTPDRKFGIYVIKAGSRSEAEDIAASDPYTAAGFCAYQLYEWEVHQIMGVGPFTAAELRGHR